MDLGLLDCYIFTNITVSGICLVIITVMKCIFLKVTLIMC